MNKRPGHVNVTVETGYCNFCGRTRNLRREEHQLGTLVRMIITCETCHRTLSSEVGVATVEPETAEAPVTIAPEAAPTAKAPARTRAAPRAQAPVKPAAKPKAAAAKPTASSAKTKTPAKRAPTKKK